MLTPARTGCLAVVELVTVIVFIQHWTEHEMISEFLYGDAGYRRLMTFYTLLHIAILFIDSKVDHRRYALIVGAAGWCTLIICTNRGPRLWHCLGVVVYAVGIYVYVFMRSTDYHIPWNRISQTATALSLILAAAYAYLESYRTPYTFNVQHALFLVSQAMYAFFVHYSPDIY